MQQGAFYESLVFMSQYPQFTYDCVVLSICSAAGQIFIFNTIKEFGNALNYLVIDKMYLSNNDLPFFFIGPIVFTIIMTIKQALAILLSCYKYGHVITVIQVIGILIVFSAVGLKIYCGYRISRLNQPSTANKLSNDK